MQRKKFKSTGVEELKSLRETQDPTCKTGM
jgi:hypothetical protein